ncbi:TrmO family methyltransferase [Streptomyces sp. NBC_01433]|uniref:TrmO family methyltransferase domain-containing protein n=1 Tax=Streptomyces sp. NBC_01433 TaxID=2903864 RepID=UPI00225A6AA2|nr:TrmO family methyltransferase [Streptomyces sp. NBC_01433]MCX4681448.1 TrmO family methyltransferase [Streptomyces sp. NBC_01433]
MRWLRGLLRTLEGLLKGHRTLEVPIIATVVGGHTGRLDDYKGGVVSIIRLSSDFPPETLQGIDEFSHLQVIWHFHEGSATDVALHARSPRDNPAWPATGTFVHHNHRRPARIATSYPRLLRVDGLDLHVEGLDADDGTPIIDLVAVFTQFLPRGLVTQPTWPDEMLKDYWTDSKERP